MKAVERSEPTPTMGQTFARHAGHSEEKEGIPSQGDLTSEGHEGDLEGYNFNSMYIIAQPPRIWNITCNETFTRNLKT